MSAVLKRRFREQIMVMFGREPKKPVVIAPEAQKIHLYKRGNRDLIAEKLHARAHAEHKNTWRNRRWATLLIVNLLFTLSFFLDIQILEGALTASRFIGFHLIDLNSALQVMLAHKHIINNLLIGTGTVLVLWILLGGRTFCSWVCPYHLLAEWAEKLHVYLVKKKLVTDQTIDRRLRSVFWLIFAVLAVATGYTVFEAISPTGILSRALIYGPGRGAAVGAGAAGVRGLLLQACMVPLRLPDRPDLRRGRHHLAAAHQVHPRRLFPRGRLPQGLPGAACAGHGDQGPGGRYHRADRTGLHALRPVRGHLPDRLAEVRGQGAFQAALKLL